METRPPQWEKSPNRLDRRTLSQECHRHKLSDESLVLPSNAVIETRKTICAIGVCRAWGDHHLPYHLRGGSVSHFLDYRCRISDRWRYRCVGIKLDVAVSQSIYASSPERIQSRCVRPRHVGNLCIVVDLVDCSARVARYFRCAPTVHTRGIQYLTIFVIPYRQFGLRSSLAYDCRKVLIGEPLTGIIAQDPVHGQGKVTLVAEPPEHGPGPR